MWETGRSVNGFPTPSTFPGNSGYVSYSREERSSHAEILRWKELFYLYSTRWRRCGLGTSSALDATLTPSQVTPRDPLPSSEGGSIVQVRKLEIREQNLDSDFSTKTSLL